MHNKRRNTWELEDDGMDIDGETMEPTIIDQHTGAVVLKDTAV